MAGTGFHPDTEAEAGLPPIDTLPSRGLKSKKPLAAVPAGATGAGGGVAPGGGVGLEAFFTEQQLAARKHVEQYKSAVTEQEQRRLWRTWVLEARKEASSGRSGEWLVTCKQLAELPGSLVTEGAIKSPDLWLEQQLIWKVFEMKRASAVSGGPVGQGGMAEVTGDMDGMIWKYLFGNEANVAARLPFLSVDKGQAGLNNVTAAEAIEKLDAAVAVDTRMYVKKDGRPVPNEKYGVTTKSWAKTTDDGLAAFKAAYPHADPVDLEYVFRAGEDAYVLASEQAKYSFKDNPSWAWLAKAIRPDLEMLDTPGGSAYIKEQVVRGAVPMLLSGYLSENTGRSPAGGKLPVGQILTRPFYRLKAVDATARARGLVGKDLRSRDFEEYEEYAPRAGYTKNPNRVSLLSVYYGREVKNAAGLVAEVKGEELVEIFTKDPYAGLELIKSQGAAFLSKSSEITKSALVRQLMALCIEYYLPPDRGRTILYYPKTGESIAKNEARLGHANEQQLMLVGKFDQRTSEQFIRFYAGSLIESDYVALLQTYCPNLWLEKGKNVLLSGAKLAGNIGLGIITGGGGGKRR